MKLVYHTERNLKEKICKNRIRTPMNNKFVTVLKENDNSVKKEISTVIELNSIVNGWLAPLF